MTDKDEFCCERCEEPSDELNDNLLCPDCMQSALEDIIDQACDRMRHGDD